MPNLSLVEFYGIGRDLTLNNVTKLFLAKWLKESVHFAARFNHHVS